MLVVCYQLFEAFDNDWNYLSFSFICLLSIDRKLSTIQEPFRFCCIQTSSNSLRQEQSIIIQSLIVVI